MPRPSQLAEQRTALLPIVARTFADLGYRRTTTAELAERCGVKQNILYRLWPDKKAMFIAAIDYVYDLSVAIWEKVLSEGHTQQTGAERLLEYEAKHHGEFGHYRIVFAGLSETDDADIRKALVDMYQRYQRFVRQQIVAHQHQRQTNTQTEAGLAAWALIGLGTVVSIGRELGLLRDSHRRKLMGAIGNLLLEDSTG